MTERVLLSLSIVEVERGTEIRIHEGADVIRGEGEAARVSLALTSLGGAIAERVHSYTTVVEDPRVQKRRRPSPLVDEPETLLDPADQWKRDRSLI